MSLSTAASNTYPLGQCTWWAAERFHQLTGMYIPWKGNAKDWASMAQQAGYNTSDTPRVGSIVVLQPGVQGAGGTYGHVAVVEKLNGDGSFVASNQNWAGITYPHTTNVTFHTGQGVSFINATANSGSTQVSNGAASGIQNATPDAPQTDTTSDPVTSAVQGALKSMILDPLQTAATNVVPVIILVLVGLLLVILAVVLLAGKNLKIPVRALAESAVV